MAGQILGFFSVRILIRPKFWVVQNYFLPKFFENRIILFFLEVTQMKIYTEDQFLRGNMWGKRTRYCWNDVLVMYQINTSYVSFIINNMIAITVIFCLFLLSRFWYILRDSQFQCLLESLKCNFLSWFHPNVPCIFFFRLLFWTGPSIKFEVLLLEWARGTTFHPTLSNHFSTSWYEEKHSPGYFLRNMANYISSYFTFLFLFPGNAIRIMF